MSVRLLLDMNISPEWVAELARHGFDSVHWVTVGGPHAADTTIMAWARSNGYVVFTHDLGLRYAPGPDPRRRPERASSARLEHPS